MLKVTHNMFKHVSRIELGLLEGLLVAASHSEVELIRIACYFLVGPPLMCALVVGWMLCVKTGSFGRLMMRCP